MTWTKYADQTPEPHQLVVVRLHGELTPTGETVTSDPLTYFPAYTDKDGSTKSARWGIQATNGHWTWERTHPEDQWRPANQAERSEP